MPIKEAKKSYNFNEIEKEVQEFWKKKEIYSKTNKLRENGPKYSFLDGPPYCSGKIHLGTAWNKIIKDTLLRFKSMNGFALRRQSGWDTHGLPIEHKVEQLLNITTKQQIESEIGIANFIDKCKEFAMDNKDAMTEQFKQLGIWMDWKDAYVTLDPKYMESCWWTLKKAYEKDLLIKDLRVISWCPRCETALAAAEIDYENKEDPSIYIKFPINLDSINNTNSVLNDLVDIANNTPIFGLVWTTTPWTIPANLAICINPEFDYSFVKVNLDKTSNSKTNSSEIYILATACVEDLFSESEYEILKTVKGNEIEGISYTHPLLDEIPKQAEFNQEMVHKILPGTHVELGEGTGCVHTAPGHGVEDFEAGKEFDLPIFCPVDEKGDFNKDGGKYASKFIKDANPEIIGDLKEKGLLWKAETINHRYGNCWRCKTPIIYLATEQWFLKITEIKDKMLSEIDKVEWVPEWAGESRFRDWVENARDWTISRQRYWGIPIPVWACNDCGKIKVLGSVSELKELCVNKDSINNISDEDLVHRPYVDEVKIQCDCGAIISRIEDVLDVWIDSGVAGWASLYYPQEKDLFEEWFPYDFITEGHDQTRGWFYSQLGAGVIAMGQSPYKKVLMHGFTLDEDGRKMSKSLGNVVQPEEVIELYGADVLRFYLLWANKPWEDLKFVWDELNNIKKMFNILWNVYVFSTTYMALDDFNPNKCIYNEDNGSKNTSKNLDENTNGNNIILRDEDKWILSRVNSLAKHVTEDLEKVFFHQATRRINYFILEDLSRWYVRLIRGRTWVEKEDPDKLGAYYTLYSVLELLIKIMAPIAPYTSENMYQNLVVSVSRDLNVNNGENAAETISKESIHMEDWKYDENAINTDLESQMDVVREVIEACARARDVARYKLRWPVSEIIVVSENDEVLNAVKSLTNVIKDQSNTKSVITSNEFENVSYSTKPNLKSLGSKLRGDIKFVHKYINSNDGSSIKAELEKEGKIIIEDNNISNEDKKIVLKEGDLLFETVLPEDVVSAEFKCEISVADKTSKNSGNYTIEKVNGNVFVNTHLTNEILSEAMARELIRRIQDMRKDMDLDVEANIEVLVDSSDKFTDLVKNQTDIINNEVRALNISFEDINDNSKKEIDNDNYYAKDWKIEEEELIIIVKKVN